MDRAGGRQLALQSQCIGRTTTGASTPRRTITPCGLGAGRYWPRPGQSEPSVEYRTGTVTPQLLRRLAQLSVMQNGPVQARELLARNGVGLEYASHLPRTHLDGAALRFPDSRPVIGLTLRYDRIDNFWFTLLHELAHVGLHMDPCEDADGFVDDHSLRGMEKGDTEEAADGWAQECPHTAGGLERRRHYGRPGTNCGDADGEQGPSSPGCRRRPDSL